MKKIWKDDLVLWQLLFQLKQIFTEIQLKTNENGAENLAFNEYTILVRLVPIHNFIARQ